MKNDYIPKIGDHVAARRKIKSAQFHNLVAGPVVDVFGNGCRIVTNKGESNEGDFQLFFADWTFQNLHLNTANNAMSGGSTATGEPYTR